MNLKAAGRKSGSETLVVGKSGEAITYTQNPKDDYLV
jgi:hypothetical protein